MLNIRVDNKKYWRNIFREAKHGHTLWDATQRNPHDPSLAYTTAHEFVNTAMYYGMFPTGSSILDIGCGNGRFGIPFSEMNVNYTGIEPMKECVDFCVKAFKEFSNLTFHHTPVANSGYGLTGGPPKEEFKFEFEDECFDDVIAYSVFTHLETVQCASNYINEIKRVLKPQGRLFITWYRSPDTADPNPFRTVYLEKDILNMMNGFKFISTYGGRSTDFYDQWGVYAAKL